MIYSPDQDSFLLLDVLKKQIPKLLKKNKNLKLLEIGIGSGIQLKLAKQLKIKNIFGIDINSKAVEHCKKLGFNCLESNLFKNVKGKFDLIIFNPPYLPEDKREKKESQLSTTGGKNGSEIINQFLIQAKNYLNKHARIFLITSSLTKKINWLDYKKKKLAQKNLFFEKLYVWELKKPTAS